MNLLNSGERSGGDFHQSSRDDTFRRIPPLDPDILLGRRQRPGLRGNLH